jgi:hypothetical protein
LRASPVRLVHGFAACGLLFHTRFSKPQPENMDALNKDFSKYFIGNLYYYKSFRSFAHEIIFWN